MNSATCQLIRDPLQPRWNKYIRNSPTPKQAAFCLLDSVNEVFFGGAAGGGKAQPLDAHIVTPTGIKTMGDMRVGMMITCPATGGTQRVILVTDRGTLPVYRVTLKDGGSCEVAGDHLWKYLDDDLTWAIGTTEELWKNIENIWELKIPKSAPVWEQGKPGMKKIKGKTDTHPCKWGAMGDDSTREIVKIEPIGEKVCRCITVDHPEGLYLTNDYIVTHNSDALLMAALQYVDVPGYNAILLRNQYTNLIKPEGLLSRATEWLTPHKEVRWNRDKKAFIFPSGATVSFGHLEGPMDHFAYQGPAYQFVGFDEVVQIREEQAMYLFSRMRKLAGKNVPLRFRSASNPPTRDQIAVGKWVKERYVDEETRREGTIFIPANLNDNPYLDKESYLESLEKLDPITRRQLRDGDWNVSAKGNLFDRGMFEIVEAVPAEGISCRWWDLAATEEKFTRSGKPTKEPDYTVGAKIVAYKGLYYIVDIRRVQWAPPKVENLVKTTAILDGRSCRIRMEQEPGSSGVAVISSYMRMLAGYNFRGIPSTGSKADYASPLSVQADVGNVKILKAHWNEQLLEEFELFPYNGVKDDQVDACSKAFAELALRPKRAGAF